MRADDSAFAEGRGCYTSALIRGGRTRFEAQHVVRLQRGARALGLGGVDAALLRRAFHELAEAAFPDGEGVVRLQLSRDGGGSLHLVGVPRSLGANTLTWAAVTAPIVHGGPVLVGGHKLTHRLVQALAGDATRAAGVDEALLFDAAGFLVEGSRSNLCVVDAAGQLVTPPLSRGAVAGIALEISRQRVPELREADITAETLRTARELVALNAVRGARAITRLDGRSVGDGQPGPGHARLAEALEAD